MEKIDDRTILEKFTEDFIIVLEKHAKYMIVSGFVAILHGRSRGTEDIDIVMQRLSPEKFALLHTGLLKAGFDCLQHSKAEVIYSYLKDNLSVRYVKKGDYLPQMELKFARDELDDYQIKTRRNLPLTGTDFFFPSIESAIAFKEEFLKSDKDIEDAHYLRAFYEGQLDENEILKVKKEIRMRKL